MAALRSMFISTAIFYASFTMALPSPISLHLRRTTNDNTTTPLSAPVVWYQATAQATTTTCGFKVSDGTLNANECYILHTAALGIQQHGDFECIFKVWDGVSDCSGDGTWTETVIPSGNATTCIYDNVTDGGDFQHKSGVYKCA